MKLEFGSITRWDKKKQKKENKKTKVFQKANLFDYAQKNGNENSRIANKIIKKNTHKYLIIDCIRQQGREMTEREIFKILTTKYNLKFPDKTSVSRRVSELLKNYDLYKCGDTVENNKKVRVIDINHDRYFYYGFEESRGGKC